MVAPEQKQARSQPNFNSIEAMMRSMDNSKVLGEIRAGIAKGDTAGAGPGIMALASGNPEDPMTLLTCASLLTAIGLGEERRKVVSMITGKPSEDMILRFETARGLRGLSEFEAALILLDGMPSDDGVRRERAENLLGLSRYADAEAECLGIAEPTVNDDIRMAGILCSLGRAADAEKKASAVLAEAPSDYDAQRCYCSVLMRTGKQKDAEKFAKENLKKDKSSADANALAAYVLYASDKIAAAGGFASKAVRTNPKHIGAMEILAMCFADKKKYSEAKIIAGAINEVAPGHPAVVRILEICG